METITEKAPITFRAGTTFDLSTQSGAIAVLSGVVAIGAGNGRSCHFVATPGDLLAVEQLLGATGRCTATALTEVVVSSVNNVPAEQLVASALLQSRRQSSEMDRLRTGPIAERVQYLIDMLKRATGGSACVPPRLHHAAAVVECTPETVCRLFTSLHFRAPANYGRKAYGKAARKEPESAYIGRRTATFETSALGAAA